MSTGRSKRAREQPSDSIPINTRVAALVPFGDEQNLTWLACIVKGLDQVEDRVIYCVEDEEPAPGANPRDYTWHVGSKNVVNLDGRIPRFFRTGDTVFAQYPVDSGFTSDFYEAIITLVPRPGEPPFYELRYKAGDETLMLQPQYIIKAPPGAGEAHYYPAAKINELRERAKRAKLEQEQKSMELTLVLDTVVPHITSEPLAPVAAPPAATAAAPTPAPAVASAPVSAPIAPPAVPSGPSAPIVMRTFKEEDDGTEIDIGGMEDVVPPALVQIPVPAAGDESVSEDTLSTAVTATTHRSQPPSSEMIPRASTAMPEIHEQPDVVPAPAMEPLVAGEESEEYDKLDRAASLFASHTWFASEMLNGESRAAEPVMWYESMSGQWRKFTESRTLEDLNDFVVAPYVVRW